MPGNIPLIASGNLNRQSLKSQAALVTGAGGGIGFEAARALCWLEARVVIAENVLSEQMQIINGWIDAVDRLAALLSPETT